MAQISGISGAFVQLTQSLVALKASMQNKATLSESAKAVNQKLDCCITDILKKVEDIQQSSSSQNMLPLAAQISRFLDVLQNGVDVGEIDPEVMDASTDLLKSTEAYANDFSERLGAVGTQPYMGIQQRPSSETTGGIQSAAESKTAIKELVNNKTAKAHRGAKKGMTEEEIKEQQAVEKKIQRILAGGGVTSLSEVGELMQLIKEFSDLIPEELMKDIEDGIQDYVKYEAQTAPDVDAFQSFMHQLRMLIQDAGREDLLDKLVDDVDFVQALQHRFHLSSEDARNVLMDKPVSATQGASTLGVNPLDLISSIDQMQPQNAFSAWMSDDQDTDTPVAVAAPSPLPLVNVNLAMASFGVHSSKASSGGTDGAANASDHRVAAIGSLGASGGAQPKRIRPASERLALALENNPNKTVMAIEAVVQAVMQERLTSSINNIEFPGPEFGG